MTLPGLYLDASMTLGPTFFNKVFRFAGPHFDCDEASGTGSEVGPWTGIQASGSSQQPKVSPRPGCKHGRVPTQGSRKVIRVWDQAHVSHLQGAAALLHQLQQGCCSWAGTCTLHPARAPLLTHALPADLCPHKLLLQLRRIFAPSIVSALQL